MIKVRYRDSNELSPGLHAAAERHGRTTVVYLLSGLTKPQRQSVLRLHPAGSTLPIMVLSGGAIAFPPAAPSSSAPQPAPSATHAASSGVCLKVGPLGLCPNV
jgi:hypothetical protein